MDIRRFKSGPNRDHALKNARYVAKEASAMLRPDVEINEGAMVLDRKGKVADFLQDIPQSAGFRMHVADDVPNTPFQDNSANHRQRVAVRLSEAVKLMQPSSQESRIIKFNLAKNNPNALPSAAAREKIPPQQTWAKFVTADEPLQEPGRGNAGLDEIDGLKR